MKPTRLVPSLLRPPAPACSPVASARTRAPALAALCGGLALSAASLQAAPMTIDSFDWSAGPTTVTEDSETTVADASILGGEVAIRTYHDDSQEITYQASGGELTLDIAEQYGEFYLTYGDDDGAPVSLPPVDLTDGGENDALWLNVEDITGEWLINIQVQTDRGSYVTECNDFYIASAGWVEMPLVEMIGSEACDFTSVVGIRLNIAPSDDNASITISQFESGDVGNHPVPSVPSALPAPLTSPGPSPVVLDGDGTPATDDYEWYEDFSPGNIDLTAGVINDRLIIDVTDITGWFRVSIYFDDGSDGEYVELYTNQAGQVEVPLVWINYIDPQAIEIASVSATPIDDTDTIIIASVYTDGPASPTPPAPPAAAPDTAKPKLKITNKKQLKRKSKRRHIVKGTASDNAAVVKVEAREKGSGWKKVRKLRPNGKWKHKTQKLTRPRNRIKFRAIDSSGNKSRPQKAKAAGPKRTKN